MFQVCKNGAFHLRGNLYVHYKSLDSAVMACHAMNGRYFAGKQVCMILFLFWIVIFYLANLINLDTFWSPPSSLQSRSWPTWLNSIYHCGRMKNYEASLRWEAMEVKDMSWRKQWAITYKLEGMNSSLLHGVKVNLNGLSKEILSKCLQYN